MQIRLHRSFNVHDEIFKRSIESRAVWLLLVFLATAGGAMASDRHGRPPSANLNGISSFFGVECAFFVIIPVGQQHELNFMLAEGESRFGITLLSVDVASNCVEIDNRGTKQTLHICSTPELSLTAGQRTGNSVAGNAGGNFNGGETAGVGNAGGGNVGADSKFPDGSNANLNPGGFAEGGQAGGTGNNTGSGNNMTSGDGGNDGTDAAVHLSADANGKDPATALNDQSGEYWYQTSASIEQSRKADAQLILSGEEDPLPLTPLTPAGTPANLIGSEALFANHTCPDFTGTDFSHVGCCRVCACLPGVHFGSVRADCHPIVTNPRRNGHMAAAWLAV